MRKLLDANVETLEQLRTLIRTVEASSSDLDSLYAESGIGRHVRHVLDHFKALEVGIVRGIVDYNKRARDSQLEKCGNLAVAEIDRLTDWLLESDVGLYGLVVQSEISISSAVSVRITSNTQRELLYMINHTVHHIAHMVLLARERGIVVADETGLAPATATHLRSEAAKAMRPNSRWAEERSEGGCHD